MKKIAVVYWSGTGNTEKMAYAVADGAKSLGADVCVMTPAEFDPDTLASYDAVGFGWPAMGDASSAMKLRTTRRSMTAARLAPRSAHNNWQ
mgnify:CR=1 FL=1